MIKAFQLRFAKADCGRQFVSRKMKINKISYFFLKFIILVLTIMALGNTL